VVNGGTPTADPENWDGDVRWATPVDLGQCNGGYLGATIRTLTESGLQTGSAEVPADSLVVSTRAPIGYVAQTSRPTAFNQGCRGLAPKAPLDTRFFRYTLLSLSDSLQSNGQGSTFTELSTESLASIRVPNPRLDRQRAIADFLDAEAARIDELVAQRRTLAELASERLAAVVEHRVRDASATFGEAPLRHEADVVVGIVITPAAWYADSGVLALRGLNVKPGRIDLTETVHLTLEGHLHNQKSELRAKDVVVVRTGQAGAAAVVPASLDGANCIDLLRIRPSANLDSHFLEAVLNSDWTQKHIGEHSVGSIQAHFNVGSLKQLPIPIPPLSVQVAIAAALGEAKRKHELLRSRCEVQLAVLQERKQALITAAVTGQLDLARNIAEEAS
jgi:type I restriction enzyme, S subunit